MFEVLVKLLHFKFIYLFRALADGIIKHKRSEKRMMEIVIKKESWTPFFVLGKNIPMKNLFNHS